MEADALILDGHLKSALAAARSLARRNIRVVCGAEHRTAPALHSRACTETFRYPNPLHDLEGFLESIRMKAGTRASVLFTFSDRTTLALSRHRDRLPENLRLLLPNAGNVESCFDKEQLASVAKNLGISTPDIRVNPSAADVGIFGFPVLLKPRMNCFWRGERGVAASVSLASTPDAARRTLTRLREQTGTLPFLQKFVSGTEFGITALCKNGAVLACAAHQRIRSLSPNGGASVLKQTIVPPANAEDAARRLLAHLRWTGPAMVEFRGGLDKKNMLIEINGRFWGSLPLFIDAGLDYPALAYAVATDMPVPAQNARIGVRSRYLIGDTAWLIRSLLRGRIGAFWSYLSAFSPRIHEDVWSLHDPAPFFWDIIHKLINHN